MTVTRRSSPGWRGTPWWSALGNMGWHPESHFADYLVKQGELEKAAAMREKFTRDIMQFDTTFERYLQPGLFLRAERQAREDIECVSALTCRTASACGVEQAGRPGHHPRRGSLQGTVCGVSGYLSSLLGTRTKQSLKKKRLLRSLLAVLWQGSISPGAKSPSDVRIAGMNARRVKNLTPPASLCKARGEKTPLRSLRKH